MRAFRGVGSKSVSVEKVTKAEAPQGMGIRSYVHPTVLALELSYEMPHHVVVNILSTHVRATSCGLDFIYAILDSQHSRLGAAAPEVKDQCVHLHCSIFAQLVRNRGCCRVVDDAEYVQPCS